MPTAANTRTFEVDVPPLRVFRHLDVEQLHPNVEDALRRREGRSDYVDTDLARDWEETEEIIAATTGAALVDSDGTIVFSEEGKEAFLRVAKAAAGAKVTVEIDLGLDEKKPRASRVVETVAEPETAFEDVPF